MTRFLSYFSIISLLLFSHLHAEEIIEYEVKDVQPLQAPSFAVPVPKKDSVEININQYDGDHSALWYAQTYPDHRFYLGLSLPYNFMNDLSNLEVASSYYPNEIIESSSSTTLATGTDTYSDTTTTVSMRSGIGFEVKGGVEYKDIFRFEGVIGQKRIMIEDVDTSYTNSDGDFYTLEDDEEIYIMLNYFGLNTYFELARGIKVISPFFGVGAGGVFPSTSGLGEDFVPYYQAMAGTSYRFSENIILEFYLQATTLNDNFDIELDSTAATYYDSSATTTYDEFTYNDVDITFEYDKEITDQIFIYSIVLSYRFLF